MNFLTSGLRDVGNHRIMISTGRQHKNASLRFYSIKVISSSRASVFCSFALEGKFHRLLACKPSAILIDTGACYPKCCTGLTCFLLQGLLPCGQSAAITMGHQEVWDSHPVNHSKGGRKW